MIDIEYINDSVDKFNALISTVNEQLENKDGSFDTAIACLNSTRGVINAVENVVKQMKQEAHDVTQDIYNKFKNKGYSKTIKF